MSAESHRPGQQPLPVLLEQVRAIAINTLHGRMTAEGFRGVSYRHGHVFRFIDEDGSRLTDLAERAEITKQALGEVVTELEKLGYVERRADRQDGRVKIIRLTDLGRECQAAGVRILADIEREWAQQVGPEQLTALRATLEHLLRSEIGPAQAS
jgi:DNA-binding MarR family transcriptional regulator